MSTLAPVQQKSANISHNIPIVRVYEKYSLQDIHHNTKIFRSLLVGDVKSIDSAIEMAKTVGRSGLDLKCPPGETVWVAMNAVSAIMDKHIDPTFVVFNRLFDFLVHFGVLDDSADCNIAGYHMARRSWVFHSRWFKGGFDVVRVGDDNAIVHMMTNKSVCEQRVIPTGILDYIALASDSYLNTPIRHSNGQLMTPLKAAVVNHRHDAVVALFGRFPSVNIDLIHPKLPDAEPLSLSAPHEMRYVVMLGEQIVTRYHFGLSSVVRLHLQNSLLPELIEIVNSYLARMPLATELLVLNK